MTTTYFDFTIPTQANDHKILGNVLMGADCLAISQIAQQYSGLTVVVTADTRSAVRLEKVLAQFSSLPVTFFQIGKHYLTMHFRHTKTLFLLV